jgi:hypothetical protein
MKLNAWQVIGIALMAVGLVGGTVLGSIMDQPFIQASVYTNIGEGEQNTLRVTLVNYESPGGQVIVAQVDGGTAVQMVLDSLGKASHSFPGGAVGYHTINLYWSDGAQSADAVLGYYVVQGDIDPTEPVEPTEAWPIAWIVAGMGGLMALIGTFGVKRLE